MKRWIIQTQMPPYLEQHTPGIFCVLRGRNSAQSQWKLGDFFPNFEKNPNLKKEKNITTHTTNATRHPTILLL